MFAGVLVSNACSNNGNEDTARDESGQSVEGSEDHRRDTILLRPHVALYGGFSGMGNEAVCHHRDPRRYSTVLWGYEASTSKNRVYHVVTAKNIARDDGVDIGAFEYQ